MKKPQHTKEELKEANDLIDDNIDLFLDACEALEASRKLLEELEDLKKWTP